MTNPIDKAQLRALAEAATQGEGQHVYTNPRDDNNWRANEQWHRAASPATIIALLDEVEALRADAARWQWLVGARTEDEATACVAEVPPPVLPQDELISTLSSWYFHKELANSLVDTAMAAMKEKTP